MFDPIKPACAALLLAASTCAAQERPDDTGAAVPDTPYRPALQPRPAEQPDSTPDRHWQEANRTVQGYNAMMLTMPPRPAAKPEPRHQEHH